MITPARLWRAWPRLRDELRLLFRSDCCSSDAFQLWYPKASWYAEHAAEMLDVLVATAACLERATRLSFAGRTTCHVTDPDTAREIQGCKGAAYRDSIVIGFPKRHLSTFAVIAAHELAHVLSHRLSNPSPPFKGEGFACYSAWLIGVDRKPCGLPLHYHPAWLLSVGVRPRLEELWERRDYSAEMYDLAWSFAVFLVQRFGRDRYFDFYRCEASRLIERVETTLDRSLSKLEKEWHDHTRSSVGVKATPIRRMHRYEGTLCTRAAWLRARNSRSTA